MIKRENKNKIFVIILKFVDLLPAEEPLLYGWGEGEAGAGGLQEVLQHPVHRGRHAAHLTITHQVTPVTQVTLTARSDRSQVTQATDRQVTGKILHREPVKLTTGQGQFFPRYWSTRYRSRTIDQRSRTNSPLSSHGCLWVQRSRTTHHRSRSTLHRSRTTLHRSRTTLNLWGQSEKNCIIGNYVFKSRLEEYLICTGTGSCFADTN